MLLCTINKWYWFYGLISDIIFYTSYTLFFSLFCKEVSLGLYTYTKPIQNFALGSTCLQISTHRLDIVAVEGP